MRFDTFARHCRNSIALSLSLLLAPSARAGDEITILEGVPVASIAASSEFGETQKAANLINHSGLQGDRHDAAGGGRTMWHTVVNPAASAVANLQSPAWIRFDFAQPAKPSGIRISTFDTKTEPDAVIATPALEARNPLVAVSATGTGDKLPAEQAGVSGDLTVTIPGKFTTATPVSLRGEKLGEALQISNRKLTIPLRAFAPASFNLN